MTGGGTFREKYWCVNGKTGMCHGLYAWQTLDDAEAYANSVALRFMTSRCLPGSPMGSRSVRHC